jgi:RNase P/RNase MRP subunit p29
MLPVKEEDTMIEKKIVKDELIGKYITIRECADPQWKDKSGIIIDETKKTFLLEIEHQRKRIAKKSATFEFTDNKKRTLIEGSRLLYRSEDRIKKAR